MKFNFVQPKYIIPLIFLPFIYIFNFMYLDMFAPKKVASNLEEQESLITTIPKPDLEKLEIDDKLDNMRKDFKEYQDFSAMADDLKETEDEVKTDLKESLYTKAEAEELMRLKDSLKELKSQTFAEEKNYANSYSNPRAAVSKSNSEYRSYQAQKAELEEQRLSPAQEFAREMRQIDSLMNPDKYGVVEEMEEMKTLETKEPKRISQVRTVKSFNKQYFNSFSVHDNEANKVEALLDEKLTVYDGSRVRIRLASDIMIDSVKLEKNSYIYGVVTGFKAQRILIGVTNILVKGKIYDVKMNIYDLDGMQGLYVPSSKFREFTKDLGGETADNMGQASQQDQSTQDMATQLVTTISQATTKAFSSFIRKNRAHLKYNTNIYLINEKN